MQVQHQSINHSNKKRRISLLILLLLLLLGLLLLGWLWSSRASLISSAASNPIEEVPDVGEYAAYLNNLDDRTELALQEVVQEPTAVVLTDTPSAQIVAQSVQVTATNDEVPLPTTTGTATATNNSPIILLPSATPMVDIWVFHPVADAFVTARRPTDNFGQRLTLDMDVQPTSHTYLRFEIPPLPAQVAYAELRLQVETAVSSNVELFLVEDDSWLERGITYENAPPMTTAIDGSDSTRLNRWLTLDVTEVVTSTGLLSFGIQSEQSTPFAFRSRESIAPPELVIVFGERPITPTPLPTLTMTPEVTATPTVPPTAVPATPNPTSPPAPIAPTVTPTDPPPIQPPPTEEPPPEPDPTEEPPPDAVELIFTAVADSYTHALLPNSNFGSANNISLDASPHLDGLLRFDLSNVAGTVESATLRVYSHDEMDELLQVFAIADDSWGEMSVTHANAPVFGAQVGQIDGVSFNTWMEIELSTAVIESDLVSLGLRTSSVISSLELSTRETSRPPELRLMVVEDEVVPPEDCDEEDNNEIGNGGFENGKGPWLFHTDADAIFSTVKLDSDDQFCNKAGRIIIKEGGDNVQLYQSNLSLKANTSYTLRFAARASRGQNLSLYLQKHEPNFKNYGLNGHEVDLTTEWQLFEITFTTKGFSGEVDDGRLRFWLAPYDQAGDVYWIDQVELIEN